MKGLSYQLKNIRRDKLCILTFLLPVFAGLAINLLSGVSLSGLSETAFCTVKGDLTQEAAAWLAQLGSITEVEDLPLLQAAVNDPASQVIGVLRDGSGIRTQRSGDEFALYRTIADSLPTLYEDRSSVPLSPVTVLPAKDNGDGLRSIFIVITLVTAMFMGCTFNAMSIIGEKEDGISLINEILPLSKKDYLLQKLSIGYAGGLLSAVLTALICIRTPLSGLLPLVIILLFSTLIAALTGLFIGHFSNGLMTGIVWIKLVMILFIAPPILFYLVIPHDSLPYALSYLLPSGPAFYGLMYILNGQIQAAAACIAALAAHSLVWLTLCTFLIRRK